MVVDDRNCDQAKLQQTGDSACFGVVLRTSGNPLCSENTCYSEGPRWVNFGAKTVVTPVLQWFYCVGAIFAPSEGSRWVNFGAKTVVMHVLQWFYCVGAVVQ
jgi:hypothetical protein